MELSKVGHSKKFALIDYVNNITKLLPDSNLDNYMHLFLYVVVIFAIIAQPASGILVAIGVLIYNIYTYYKKKTEIEPYYWCHCTFSILCTGTFKAECARA